jgi:hypothetical protein
MRRDEILRALAALGADLAERGLVADVYVVGGAAIALAYDERRATRDIDAVFVPKNEVYAAATRVAAALDLPDGWLNDAVKGFLQGPGKGADNFPTTTFDMPGLRCEVASAETVLVLKCLAHRLGEDEEDIALLAAQLHLSTADQPARPRRAGWSPTVTHTAGRAVRQGCHGRHRPARSWIDAYEPRSSRSASSRAWSLPAAAASSDRHSIASTSSSRVAHR